MYVAFPKLAILKKWSYLCTLNKLVMNFVIVLVVIILCELNLSVDFAKYMMNFIKLLVDVT